MKVAFLTAQLSSIRGGPLLMISYAKALYKYTDFQPILYDFEPINIEISYIKNVLKILNSPIKIISIPSITKSSRNKLIQALSDFFICNSYNLTSLLSLLSAKTISGIEMNTSILFPLFSFSLSKQYDIVHLGGWAAPYSVFVSINKQILSKGKVSPKYICHAIVHPFFQNIINRSTHYKSKLFNINPLRKLSLFKILSKFDAITVSTPYEYYYLKSHGLSNTYYLGEGIDYEFIQENIIQILEKSKLLRKNCDAENILLFIGARNWRKGYKDLLKAFYQIIKEKPKTILWVLGRKTNYDQEIYSLESKMIEKGYIQIYNVLSELDKYVLIGAADIAVLPSYEETIPLFFLEAWSLQKPVIGTTIPTIQSIIKYPGDGGLLIKAGDVIGIKQAIYQMLEDRALARRIGLNGYKKIINQFNLKIISRKLINIYKEVIERGN